MYGDNRYTGVIKCLSGAQKFREFPKSAPVGRRFPQALGPSHPQGQSASGSGFGDLVRPVAALARFQEISTTILWVIGVLELVPNLGNGRSIRQAKSVARPGTGGYKGAAKTSRQRPMGECR